MTVKGVAPFSLTCCLQYRLNQRIGKTVSVISHAFDNGQHLFDSTQFSGLQQDAQNPDHRQARAPCSKPSATLIDQDGTTQFFCEIQSLSLSFIQQMSELHINAIVAVGMYLGVRSHKGVDVDRPRPPAVGGGLLENAFRQVDSTKDEG